MFVNDIFKKKLNETVLNPRDPQGDYDAKRKVIHDLSLDSAVDQQAVQQRRLDLDKEAKAKGLKEQGIEEAGPFSYGAKKPKKGSVADLAAKKRKEQEKGKQPVEPRDQMAGTAKVTKGVSEGISVIDQDYDLDQLILTLDIEGKKVYFTYWDYEEDFANAERRDVFNQLQEQPWYKGLDHPTKMEILDAAFRAIRGLEPQEYRPTVRDEPLDEQGVAEGFDDLDRFMKDKYGPQPRGGSGIKTGTYGSPRRKRGRPTGAESLSGGSDIPHAVDFDRPHSERSAGRRMPRFSDDYDAIKRSEVDEGSAQDKLYKRHQELRKKSGLPDPDYYKELKASYDLPDQVRYAKQKEIKQKYKVTNEDREQYIEELGRAGYEIITEKRMTCPECGGAAYEDKMLAEKQDACYHKVKSRYKVWPSAYASGALVRCRKKGAKNWGNKSK